MDAVSNICSGFNELVQCSTISNLLRFTQKPTDVLHKEEPTGNITEPNGLLYQFYKKQDQKIIIN